MKMRLSHGSSLVISSGATTMITNTTTGDGASQRQLWAFELAGRLQMEWMLSRVTDLLLWPPPASRAPRGYWWRQPLGAVLMQLLAIYPLAADHLTAAG